MGGKLLTTVSDKNSWDTSTEFFFTMSGLSPHPLNVVITVNLSDLLHQQREGTRTVKCPNNFVQSVLYKTVDKNYQH